MLLEHRHGQELAVGRPVAGQGPLVDLLYLLGQLERHAVAPGQGGDGAEFLKAPIEPERREVVAVEEGTEIVANEMLMLGGRSSGASAAAPDAPRADVAEPAARAGNDFDDDIPF